MHGGWPCARTEAARESEQELPAPIAVLAERVIGANQVRRWRFDQLRRAGYPTGEAFALSGFGDVDLHQATRLLRDGCTLATAMQILV